MKLACYREWRDVRDERDERKDGETGSFDCVLDDGGGGCVCVAKGEGVINDVSPHTHSLLYQYWKTSYDTLVEGLLCDVFRMAREREREGRCGESEESRNCVQWALTSIDV